MKKQDTDSDTALVRYLLGQVDAEEQARIEERYLADREFHEELRAVERDLIDRYVSGELVDSADFERHFLASPGRRQRVEFARALKQSLATSQRSQAVATAAPISRAPLSGLFGMFRASRPGWRFAAAAAVAVMLVVVLFLPNRRASEQVTEVAETPPREPSRAPAHTSQPVRPSDEGGPSPREPAPARVATILLLPSLTRNSEETPTVTIDRDVNDVQLQLFIEPGDYETYRVDLQTADGTEVWRREGLRITQTSSGDVIMTTVAARLFRDEDYTIRVSGITAAGDIEPAASYYARVRKK